MRSWPTHFRPFPLPIPHNYPIANKQLAAKKKRLIAIASSKTEKTSKFSTAIAGWPREGGRNKKRSADENSTFTSDSERPTDCPRAQMSEIIKPCVAECGRDSDCPARRKCCWNGCARRCSRPLIRDPTNYLNLPLLSNDD